MRKDVKIGLGIGGVLLAVLIVYALVPKTNQTNEFAHGGDSGKSSGEGSGAAPDTGSGGLVQSGTQTGTDVPATGATSRDTTTSTDRVGSRDSSAEGTDATAATTPKVDWEKILVTGIVPDEAKVPMAARQGTSEDVFGDPKTSGPEPDFSQKHQGGQAKINTGNNEPGVTPPSRSNPTGPTQPQVAGGANKGAVKDHVVQQGENLSMIAAVAYGDARHYKDILKANPGLDEHKLRPGTTLKMPDPSTFATASGNGKAQQAVAKLSPTINPQTEYKVEQGDSLHKIAVKLYGKAAKADTLYELNKDKIGDDSSRLKLGMVLKLPEPPVAQQSAR